MLNKRDLTNQSFGRLTVLKESLPRISKNRQWLCVCVCGKNVIVQQGNLLTGNTTSCGCRKKELIVARTRTHGKRHTAEYSIWTNMKSRCFNPKATQYHNYGGRGITVCPQWKDSFEAFFADIGKRPSSDYSLERINVNGNYELANVRWATWAEQCNNRTNTAPICPCCGQKVYQTVTRSPQQSEQ